MQIAAAILKFEILRFSFAKSEGIPIEGEFSRAFEITGYKQTPTYSLINICQSSDMIIIYNL
jgi:hypothetical protein